MILLYLRKIFRHGLTARYVLNCFSKHKENIQQVLAMKLVERVIYLKIKKTP